MKLTAFRCKIRSSLQYSFSVPGRTKCSSGLNLNEMIMWFNTDVFAHPWNGNCFMGGGDIFLSCHTEIHVFDQMFIKTKKSRNKERQRGTFYHNKGHFGPLRTLGGGGGARALCAQPVPIRLFIWACLWDTKIRDSHKHARTSICKRAYETPK